MNMNTAALQLDLSRTAPAHPPRSAGAGFKAMLATYATSLAHAVQARRQERQTRRVLSQLADHLRRDIGLPPSAAPGGTYDCVCSHH